MKKSFLFFFILFFISGIYAQATKIMAGLSYSKMAFDEEDPKIKNQWGFLGGIGMEMGTANFALEMAAMSFFIEGRYHHGLANLSKEVEASSIKSQSMLVMAGFKF